MVAKKAPITPERLAEIAASAAGGRHLSMFDGETPGFGAQCRCGLPRKPAGLAKHVQDDGVCVVHPDKPPQPYVRGVSAPTSDNPPPAG